MPWILMPPFKVTQPSVPVLVQPLPWTLSEVSRRWEVHGLAGSYNWPTLVTKLLTWGADSCTGTNSDGKSLSCTNPQHHGGTLPMLPCVFKGGRNNLFEAMFYPLVWKTGYGEVSFTNFQFGLLQFMILQLDAETADGWLDKKQPMPSRANTSRVLCKWSLLCQNTSGQNLCPWLEFESLGASWIRDFVYLK